MIIPARKLSFQEAWDTITIFLVDEALEDEIDQRVNRFIDVAGRYGIKENKSFDITQLISFLKEEPEGLEFLL